MSTKFFTNKEGNSLLKKFEGVLEHIPNLHSFDVLVGYFRASGYFLIRPYLENIPNIRILVGINVDPIVHRYNAMGQQYIDDPDETKESFFERLKADIASAKYDQATEDGVTQFLKDVVAGKIIIKAHARQNLHAKVYIFKPENFNEYSTGVVITGSSNFSRRGFGTSTVPIYEFNVELREYVDIKFAADEFEELWAEAVDVLPVDLLRLKQETYLNDSITPFELYIKLLIEYFGKRIDYDPANVDLLLPERYMRLTYQAEAAIEGYEKLMAYNGFFLADVVGLGKTVIACIIAKKFVYENGYHSKILVVFPPALENNWKRTIKDFHIWNNVSFVSTGNLHKVLDGKELNYPNADEYDLIIIDEAHKFRNDTSQMYEKLQMITKTDRRIPGRNGDIRKKVMLLSATPLNNHPSDIENQVYLFQDKRSSSLPKLKDLQGFFSPLKKEYDLLKKERVLDVKKVKALYDRIRDKVVEPLVIRRTRTDIENNSTYSEDIQKQGIIFPKINPPYKVEYELDNKLSSLFDRTITLLTCLDDDGLEIDGLGYYRYRAIEFLIDEEKRKKRYGDVVSISKQLSAIMKTLLVKRLESSFYAFKMSLSRFLKNTRNMIDMFESNKVYIAPDVDVNKYLNMGDEEGLELKMNEKGGNNLIYERAEFHEEFLTLLKQDYARILALNKEWEGVNHDPKLEKFLEDLAKIFLDKKKNHEGKLVIFSESKETVDYLEKALNQRNYQKTLAISADNRKEKEETIRLNFDANYDKSKWQHDFDFVLTTEVLAEGINLHRSNVIINYDVPWNSTRLMQRIGRVNRIGTEASEIHIYNFYPSDKADNLIKLTNTAIRKLQAFHTAFGEDSQIYSQLEEVGEAGLYGIKLKEEGNASLTYLQELRDFKKQNPNWFDKIKKLPQQSRVVRTNANVKENARLEGGAITYLKSDGHPGVFYRTDAHNVIHELGFLEAAGIFKAIEAEKAASKLLPEKHYDQVNLARTYFMDASKAAENRGVVKADLSSAEKRVLTRLEFFAEHTKSDFYKRVITRAISELYKGAHRQLPNRLDRFFKKSKKAGINDPDVVVDNLYNDVLKSYNFSELENVRVRRVAGLFANPKIVLSASFV